MRKLLRLEEKKGGFSVMTPKMPAEIQQVHVVLQSHHPLTWWYNISPPDSLSRIPALTTHHPYLYQSES